MALCPRARRLRGRVLVRVSADRRRCRCTPPSLGAHRAAVVQLSVPVLTAVAAIFVLGEPLRTTVALGGAAIVGGLALALSAMP